MFYDDVDVPIARLMEIYRESRVISGSLKADLNILHVVYSETNDTYILSSRYCVENDPNPQEEDCESPQKTAPSLVDAVKAHDTFRRSLETRPGANNKRSIMCSAQKSRFNINFQNRTSRQVSIDHCFGKLANTSYYRK